MVMGCSLQKKLKEIAVDGELIRFGIESLDKIGYWKKKHHIQDMQFVTIPLLEKELGTVAQKIREIFEDGFAEIEDQLYVAYQGVTYRVMDEKDIKKLLARLQTEVKGLLVEGEKDDGVSKRLLRISKREK